MDFIKKLTGKNPSEYEPIAKSLVDNSDVELFTKLVSQDDFLFDFIKDNVAKRIQRACTEKNYLNLLNFLDVYSPSYDTVIAEVLHNFGKEEIFDKMKLLYQEGTDNQKAYALKYFSFVDPMLLKELLPAIRISAMSENDFVSYNAIEILSNIKDKESKDYAISQLSSDDEFEQFKGVKFLVAYGAKDKLAEIIKIMKKSSLAENIAAEIIYMVAPDELIKTCYEDGLLVLANIINAIPDILPPSIISNYNMKSIFEDIIKRPLDSASAVILRLAKDKFAELTSNEEYLFDSDKNTKEEIKDMNKLLQSLNNSKLSSYFYDELYEESDFVFYAVDFVDEIEELETLLESKNQTLILKVLTILKEKDYLNSKHKEIALQNVFNDDIKNIILAI